MTLRLQGATNFRDLGGYLGQGGRRVRHHRLFRSDHLAALTPADLALLQSALGPSLRVCDLRGTAERLSAPCALPGATVHSLPIEPTIVQKLSDLLTAGHPVSPGQAAALMQDTYRGFVRGNTPRYAALFGHLLDDHDVPLVFHCTAGKDRTGFGAALILSALGVPRSVVMEDFLLTNERLKGEPVARGGLPVEIVSVLFKVQQEFLLAALEAVEQDFGGMDAYLERAIGLGRPERERLQARYLAG